MPFQVLPDTLDHLARVLVRHDRHPKLKVPLKDKTGRADIALNSITKLHGIARDLSDGNDEGRKAARLERSLPLLAQLTAG